MQKRELYIPKGATKYADRHSSAILYVHERNGATCLLGFSGKRQRPDFHVRYPSRDRAAKAASRYFESVQKAEKGKLEREAERRAKLAQPHDWKVGDIGYCSWGYEQTNIDWYQVVALSGKRTVHIRRIRGSVVKATGPMSETVVAEPDDWYDDKVLKRRVNEHGTFKDRYGDHGVYRWDGAPKYSSSYH